MIQIVKTLFYPLAVALLVVSAEGSTQVPSEGAIMEKIYGVSPLEGVAEQRVQDAIDYIKCLYDTLPDPVLPPIDSDLPGSAPPDPESGNPGERLQDLFDDGKIVELNRPRVHGGYSAGHTGKCTTGSENAGNFVDCGEAVAVAVTDAKGKARAKEDTAGTLLHELQHWANGAGTDPGDDEVLAPPGSSMIDQMLLGGYHTKVYCSQLSFLCFAREQCQLVPGCGGDCAAICKAMEAARSRGHGYFSRLQKLKKKYGEDTSEMFPWFSETWDCAWYWFGKNSLAFEGCGC